MPDETLARRYATAIFSLAQEADSIAPVAADLHAFAGVLAADADVRRFFRSPVVDRHEKAVVLTEAFGRLNEIVLHALLLLVRKRRETLFESIVTQYDQLERAARGAQALRVTSARELSAEELRSLVDRLTATFRTTFDVEQEVDPQLIGGIRIRLGDKLIDGTISGRLDDLARTLSTN